MCDCVKTYPADDFVGAEDFDGSIITEPKDGEFAHWIPEQGKMCLSYNEICTYGNGKPLYGWHISDLKIYDKPKEVGDFHHCGVNYHYNPSVTKPPQSWCYVEELQNGGSINEKDV